MYSEGQKIRLKGNVERSINILGGGHGMRQLAGEIVKVSLSKDNRVRIIDLNNGMHWWFLISDTLPTDIEKVDISPVIFDPNNLCV